MCQYQGITGKSRLALKAALGSWQLMYWHQCVSWIGAYRHESSVGHVLLQWRLWKLMNWHQFTSLISVTNRVHFGSIAWGRLYTAYPKVRKNAVREDDRPGIHQSSGWSRAGTDDALACLVSGGVEFDVSRSRSNIHKAWAMINDLSPNDSSEQYCFNTHTGAILWNDRCKSKSRLFIITKT